MVKSETLGIVKNDKRPNLFIVGGAKCGTTTLADLLASDDEIFMPWMKEPYYFPSRYINLPLKGPGDRVTFIHNEDEYLDLYKRASQKKYLLDATVDHLYIKECAQDIYSFNPNSKIIIMLRNPTDRAYSSYKHLLRDNREKLSFEESLNLERERIKDNWGILWRYTDVGFYYKNVKEYQDVFGAKNVKIIFSDEFIKNQARTLKDLSGWLDIKLNQNIYSSQQNKLNKGGKPNFKLKWMLRLRKIHLINQLGKKFVPKDKYRNFMQNNTQDIYMKRETRVYLNELFRDDIINLEKLLSTDLSKWYS